MLTAEGPAFDAYRAARERLEAAKQDYDVAVAMATIELPEIQRQIGITSRCLEWWPA